MALNPDAPEDPKAIRPTRRSSRAARMALRRLRLLKLLRRGFSQHEVARRLGITLAHAYKEKKLALEELRRYTLTDTAHIVALELAKLDEIEAQAIDGWRRSRRDAVRTTERTASGDGTGDKPSADRPSVPLRELTIMREGQSGDPRFLTARLAAMERRSRLLGLDKPAKLDVAFSDLPPIIIEQGVPEQPRGRVIDVKALPAAKV